MSLATLSRGLGDEDADVWDLVRPERDSLARLKKVSLRNRAWFAVLTWTQRRFMDLVIRTVDSIRSVVLLRVLAPLVRRLLTAIGGDARKGALVLMGEGSRLMMKKVAEKIARVAEKWGNTSAREWLDESFIRFLLVMNLPQNENRPFLGVSRLD